MVMNQTTRPFRTQAQGPSRATGAGGHDQRGWGWAAGEQPFTHLRAGEDPSAIPDSGEEARFSHVCPCFMFRSDRLTKTSAAERIASGI